MEKKEIAKIIRDARVSAGIKAKDLAGMASISASYLADIERARTSPSIQTLGKIARALGKTIPSLLLDENPC